MVRQNKTEKIGFGFNTAPTRLSALSMEFGIAANII